MVVWTTPPGIGIGPHPGPGLLQTPLTGVEEYRFPCLVQSSRLQIRMTHHATIAWTVLQYLKVIVGTIYALYTVVSLIIRLTTVYGANDGPWGNNYYCPTAHHLVVWSTLVHSCGRIE